MWVEGGGGRVRVSCPRTAGKAGALTCHRPGCPAKAATGPALLARRSAVRAYREYCRARLAEMRKQLLVSAESHEVPEVCDVSHHGDSAGRDSGFGDDRTAT